MNNKSNIELMAPVGSYESLHAAIDAGCDSIYFGITQLNMRARSANNFTLEDLKKIVGISKGKNVKTYLTLNTILYNHDLNLAYRIIDAAKEASIDAIICADMAAIIYANKIDQIVHISTQMSISNIEMVKFYAQYSDMVVLARELTLPMVKAICDEIKTNDIRGRSGELMKIEVFGHGAMCVAYSGRCHMSLLTDNSAANRGACVQNCRRKYRVIDEETGSELILENNYVMSPTDLSTIGLLDELISTGISTIKIEGRGRSADYVNTVITCYREALDSIATDTYTKDKIKKWNKKLGTVYNRGHSGGFYMGKPYIEWSGVYGNKATQKRIFLGLIKRYYPKLNVVEVKINSNKLLSSDKYIITGTTTGIVRGENPTIWLDDTLVKSAKKGDTVTFKQKTRVRVGDRLYKIIPNNNKA